MTNQVSVSLRVYAPVCVCACVCVCVCVCVCMCGFVHTCVYLRVWPLFHPMKHMIMFRFKTTTASMPTWCAIVDFEDFEDLRTYMSTFILLAE